MGFALGMAMPWFLSKLRQDFTLWSQGKDRKQATGKGEMNDLAKQLAAGARSFRSLGLPSSLSCAEQRSKFRSRPSVVGCAAGGRGQLPKDVVELPPVLAEQ